ncbi:hypothetical protein CAEBREN_06860 [Caenorhabditis brenneri]|uniref:Uncharacterized protein n=1 Tax=Caenorhabditis brenneri TaxID=135651 RepID=G0MAR0_CAEBE|nr:hypothetical protein CAEBREN_06860 [Caenorhabditis brenneri]
MQFRVVVDRNQTIAYRPNRGRWMRMKLWAVQMHEDGCLWRFAVVVLVMILLLVIFFLPLTFHNLI